MHWQICKKHTIAKQMDPERMIEINKSYDEHVSGKCWKFLLRRVTKAINPSKYKSK